MTESNLKHRRRTSDKKSAPSDKSDNRSNKPRPNFGDPPSIKNHRFWARVVLIIGIGAIVYFSSQRTKEKKFAQFKETLDLRTQKLYCSHTYLDEIRKFPECVPPMCGRFVTDSLITPLEVDAMLSIAKAGFEFGGSSGGASILDLHSGALSKDKKFVNIYKMPEAKGIFKPELIKMYTVIKSKIQHALSEKFEIDINSLYLTHPTFFSRITKDLPKTMHDEYWHPHVDKETYNSFHYTSLLYLSDFSKEFTGGRFVFIDGGKHNKTNVIIEPKRGRVSAFTSGAENLHSVEKVTSGIRYAMTISFTCDKTHSMSDPTFYLEGDDD